MAENRPQAELYPEIDPYQSGMLDVGDGHQMYYEVCGNPSGKPVVFLHGGPGGGCKPAHRRFFDPSTYRVVLFDQRGCGRSKPLGLLDHNTTWHLVEDIERLRTLLGIEKWMVFGGSWGSLLGLAYAQRHPGRVTSMILRGIFLGRRHEIDWFYQGGARPFFPEYWPVFRDFIPEDERGDMMRAYYRRLTSQDEELRMAAAEVCNQWESLLVGLPHAPNVAADGAASLALTPEQKAQAMAAAVLAAHYTVNGCFLQPDDLLLREANRLQGIPLTLVQGRYDMITPPISAYDLHNALPESKLIMVPGGSHHSSDPAIRAALLDATDAVRGD
ncbi:MAG: prolyl aminopeptidase [Alphaproteobacteria bacterium]|nr:MAG: prolyl aminopeptidase [Alphaproteobacteria bacterium]